MTPLALGVLFAAALASWSAPASAAGDYPTPPGQSWSWSGPFGLYDRGALQRGLKVYEEACAACHGIRLVSFRNLSEPGGPEFTEAEVRAIAAQFQVTDGPDEMGDMFERPGVATDRFPSPFPNEQAARAALGGSYPPDLSVMTKARPHGPDYLHALLVGYREPPAGVTMRQGMYYNEYFPGHQIAMPPPFSDGQIEYADGAPETVEQYSRDVTTFLMWTAEPKMEERKRIGFQVMIFLVVFAGLLYLSKRKLWREVDH